MIKGQTLGDISIFTREEHSFSAEEIAVFTTLAEQVAIAIHNSQLFDETKRQADELREPTAIEITLVEREPDW